MALLKLGALAVDIRGSIAGTTFARNRGGVYARARTKPIQPISPRRDEKNAILSQVIQTWHATLTVDQRVAWNEAAKAVTIPNKLGEPYTPTGANLYVRANVNLILSDQAVITVPPPAATGPALAATVGISGVNGLLISQIGEFDTALTGNVMWQYSAPQRESINFFKGPWNILNSFPIGNLAALPEILVPFADLVASKRYFLRMVVVLADGSAAPSTINVADMP